MNLIYPNDMFNYPLIEWTRLILVFQFITQRQLESLYLIETALKLITNSTHNSKQNYLCVLKSEWAFFQTVKKMTIYILTTT